MFKYLSICVFLLCSQISFAAESDASVETMRQGLQNLNQEHGFGFVDLEIQEYLPYIEQLKINKKEIYDQFGQLDSLKENLPIFFRNIGNDDEEVIAKVTEAIVRVTERVNKACNKKTAWISVRAFVPNNTYDTPRWHSDGNYYSYYSGFNYKFVASLVGSATMFYPLPSELRETYWAHIGEREFLNQLLDINLALSPKIGEGAFFIVGDQHSGAVHSEPPIKANRLFFSIVPGDEPEIAELYKRWYPY